MDDKGSFDLSQAYDTGIGEWDKRTILYGYQDFPEETDETEALDAVLRENSKLGLLYISDEGARPRGGAHPSAHLWDNGENANDELQRIIQIRHQALSTFGANTISDGVPMAELERILVPVYLMHRYQVDASSKLIGGQHYAYTVKGDGLDHPQIVSADIQEAALVGILETLEPSFLTMPAHITTLIPPQPPGYARNREYFDSYQGLTFDPLAAAEGSSAHSLDFLLDPQRLSRILDQESSDNSNWTLEQYLDRVSDSIHVSSGKGMINLELQIAMGTEHQFVERLFRLSGDKTVHHLVSANALRALLRIHSSIMLAANPEEGLRAHYRKILFDIDRFMNDPDAYEVKREKEMPPGSPIGCSDWN